MPELIHSNRHNNIEIKMAVTDETRCELINDMKFSPKQSPLKRTLPEKKRVVSGGSKKSSTSSKDDFIHHHAEILKTLLQRIVSHRALKAAAATAATVPKQIHQPHHKERDETSSDDQPTRLETRASIVVEEITEMIEVHRRNSLAYEARRNTENESSNSSDDGNTEDSKAKAPLSWLSPKIQEQVQRFVEKVASCYHDSNPFHNFDHASHVTFSSYQLLRKVAAQDLPPVASLGSNQGEWGDLPFSDLQCEAAQTLAGDTLAHFALVFSALIHDVDHVGVPNFVLAKEKPDAAAKYQNRSIAEQTSVDVAWDLLEQDEFQDLKECLMPTVRDHQRFRSMVVNIVMATDAFDKTLRDFHNQKWTKAFESPPPCQVEHRNRKATLMMDLVMMTSDISHTMQSFDVYCEWNEKLYREMYAAFREGRSSTDPSNGWVAGEIVFFNKHILPLAQRVQDCGMFGTQLAAYMLQNARANRKQWQVSGKVIFADLQARVKCEYDSSDKVPCRDEDICKPATKRAKVLSPSARST